MYIPDAEEYGGIVVMDEKEKLANELCMALSSVVPDVYMLKNDIWIILNKYDIRNRCTEVGMVFTDRNEELIKRFLIAKTVKGCTARTIEFYQNTLKRFMERVNKNIDDITSDDIRLDSALRIRRDKVNKTTAGNEIRCYRTFFNWLSTEELIQKNPMLKVDPIKKEKIKKEAFTEMEVEMLRAHVNGDREKAIIEILLSTGCRVSELVQIKVSEVEMDRERVLVHGKGNKDRFVYLNARAELAIKTYMSERKDNNPYLFPGGKKITEMKNGKSETWWMNPENIGNTHLGKETIGTITRKLAERAGVQQANPHKFRRTCATWALRRGMPIEQVSKMLGHDQISTTQIYLDLNEEELVYAHKKFVI